MAQEKYKLFHISWHDPCGRLRFAAIYEDSILKVLQTIVEKIEYLRIYPPQNGDVLCFDISEGNEFKHGVVFCDFFRGGLAIKDKDPLMFALKEDLTWEQIT